RLCPYTTLFRSKLVIPPVGSLETNSLGRPVFYRKPRSKSQITAFRKGIETKSPGCDPLLRRLPPLLYISRHVPGVESPVGSILIIKNLLEPKRHSPAPKSRRNRMMFIGRIFKVTFQGEVMNVIFTFKGRTGKLEFMLIEIPGTCRRKGSVELYGNSYSP